jgi:hypothetical protein
VFITIARVSGHGNVQTIMPASSMAMTITTMAAIGTAMTGTGTGTGTGIIAVPAITGAAVVQGNGCRNRMRPRP